MNYFHFVYLFVCLAYCNETSGQKFLETYAPKMDEIITMDMKDLGEISCSFVQKGSERYSIATSINGEYALLKMRNKGRGWDSIRNREYYSAVKVDSNAPSAHSIINLIRNTDASWSSVIERRKTPIFSLIFTADSTLQELVRSGAFSVAEREVSGGIEFTLTANDEDSDVHQYVLEFDAEYEFPKSLTQYLGKSKTHGSKYLVKKFEKIDNRHYPAMIEFDPNFGDKIDDKISINISYAPEKTLDVQECKLEFYGLSNPAFELANQPQMPLSSLLVAATILIVLTGGTWFYLRNSKS